MLADSDADLIVLAASTYTGCTLRSDLMPGVCLTGNEAA